MLRWIGKHTFERLTTFAKGLKADGEIDLTSNKVLMDFKDGDTSSVDPGGTDNEAGWINVKIDGTTKYIPYFDGS